MTPAISQEKPAIIISVISIRNTVYMLPFKDVSLPCGYGLCFSVKAERWLVPKSSTSLDDKRCSLKLPTATSLSWLFIFHSSVENPFSQTNSWKTPPKKNAGAFSTIDLCFLTFFWNATSISRVLCAAIFPGAGNFHPWNESPWHPPQVDHHPLKFRRGSPLAFLHRILPATNVKTSWVQQAKKIPS